jgi:PAS domain S-box-containing protein
VADSLIQMKPEEPALRQSEERERQLVRNAPVAMVVSDRKTRQIELANDRFIKLFGYRLEDIPGVEDWWPIAYPDESYREKVKAEWAARTERVFDDPERIERMEARVRCKDGVFRDIEFHLSVFGDSFLVSFVDLRDRRHAEQALRESEERLRLAAQAGKMYAFEWDTVTDKVVLSAESADILGFSSEPGQRTGQGWFARIFPQDRANFLKMIAELKPNKPTYQTSYRIVSPSGEFIWLEESATASFDAQGRAVRVVGMVSNVTSRKEVERALATVSGKLIEAQERERRRIARDLHDDINQRLALLNIELQRLAGLPSGLTNGTAPERARVIPTGLGNFLGRFRPYPGIALAKTGTPGNRAGHARLLRRIGSPPEGDRRLPSQRCSRPLAAGCFFVPVPGAAGSVAQCSEAQQRSAVRSAIARTSPGNRIEYSR